MLKTSEQKDQVKEAVINKAKEEGTKALQDLTKGTEAENIVGNLLGKDKKTQTGDSTAKPTEEPKKEEVKKQVENAAKDKINNLLKRK